MTFSCGGRQAARSRGAWPAGGNFTVVGGMAVETCLCPAMEAVGVYRCAGLCLFAFLSTAEIKPGSRRSNELHLTAKGSVAYGEGTSVFPLVKCYITLPKAQGVSPIKHSSTQKPSISFEAMKWMAFHITTHLT